MRVAEVVRVHRIRTLKDAINEAFRDWVTTVETSHYFLCSVMGPDRSLTMVRDFQRIIVWSQDRSRALTGRAAGRGHLTAWAVAAPTPLEWLSTRSSPTSQCADRPASGGVQARTSATRGHPGVRLRRGDTLHCTYLAPGLRRADPAHPLGLGRAGLPRCRPEHPGCTTPAGPATFAISDSQANGNSFSCCAGPRASSRLSSQPRPGRRAFQSRRTRPGPCCWSPSGPGRQGRGHRCSLGGHVTAIPSNRGGRPMSAAPIRGHVGSPPGQLE